MASLSSTTFGSSSEGVPEGGSYERTDVGDQRSSDLPVVAASDRGSGHSDSAGGRTRRGERSLRRSADERQGLGEDDWTAGADDLPDPRRSRAGSPAALTPIAGSDRPPPTGGGRFRAHRLPAGRPPCGPCPPR